MTDHVLHVCPAFAESTTGPKDGLEWGKAIEWPVKEIPLNKRRHENCPYCGAPTDEMEAAGGDLVRILNQGRIGTRNLRGGAENAAASDIASMRRELSRLRQMLEGSRGRVGGGDPSGTTETDIESARDRPARSTATGRDTARRGTSADEGTTGGNA